MRVESRSEFRQWREALAGAMPNATFAAKVNPNPNPSPSPSPTPTPTRLAAAAAPPLLAGWKEAKAPDGRTYYFHTETKETKWTRPAEP